MIVEALLVIAAFSAGASIVCFWTAYKLRKVLGLRMRWRWPFDFEEKP